MGPRVGGQEGSAGVLRWPEAPVAWAVSHPVLGALHFDDLGSQREARGLLRAPVDLAKAAPAGTTTQQAQRPRSAPTWQAILSPGLSGPTSPPPRVSTSSPPLHTSYLKPREELGPLHSSPHSPWTAHSHVQGSSLPALAQSASSWEPAGPPAPAPHQSRKPTYPPKTSCWHTV